MKKTDTYPYREPKKYTKKSLHGRIRFGQLAYSDFKRFQKFYVNVFGWDMFELPEAAGGVKKAVKTPRFSSRRDRVTKHGRGSIPDT